MSQATSVAGEGVEDLLSEPGVGDTTLDEIDCEVKAVEEFVEGIREEKRDVTTAIQNLLFFCQVLLRDVCRWRDRRQNRAGHKESSVSKEPAEKECAEAVGETSALSELTAKIQDINVKGDECQEEEQTHEDEGSKEESDSGSVEWEDDDDIEGEEGEEVNLQEDSLLVDNTILDIEDVVDELRGSPPPDLDDDDDDDDVEMPVEFLQSLVAIIRKELTAAELEREMLERHEKSLSKELEALNETRTSWLNASACGRTDGSLVVPVVAEAESRKHEGEDEQAPTTGEKPIDASTAGESCEDAMCALQTTEKEDVTHEVPPAVGEAAGEATCLLEPEVRANPTLAISQDLSRTQDSAYVAAQTERN